MNALRQTGVAWLTRRQHLKADVTPEKSLLYSVGSSSDVQVSCAGPTTPSTAILSLDSAEPSDGSYIDGATKYRVGFQLGDRGTNLMYRTWTITCALNTLLSRVNRSRGCNLQSPRGAWDYNKYCQPTERGPCSFQTTIIVTARWAFSISASRGPISSSSPSLGLLCLLTLNRARTSTRLAIEPSRRLRGRQLGRRT